MSWLQASIRAALIVAYFIVATVWLPDVVVNLDPIAGGSAIVRDAVVLAVWGGGFVAGAWFLRRSQRRETV